MAVSKLLRSVSQSPAQKSHVPTESVDATVKRASDKVVKTKVAMEDAVAVYTVAEADLLAITSRIYAERAENGKFAKSMNIDGETTAGVQVVYADKFSAIDADSPAEASLREALGSKFDSLFTEKRTVALDKTDDATIELLIEKLGEKLFLEIFKVRVQIAPVEGFDKLQFELPSQVRELVKQSKASVRLRKE